MENNLENTPGIETTHPVSELLIVWIVSIPGVFSKLFSTCFLTSYWVSCFNSRCILQVVFHLLLNFLLGELFQFQVYSSSCFQPVSELLIGWVVSIPGVFSKLFSTSYWTSYWVSVSIPGVFFKLFSTCFWTSYWVSCFNSRCILQVVLHLFLNFLLGELFQFQVYSPSCFQPLSALLIWWVVSIPGVFSKLFSTSFWTSYWVRCFNSRCILQVVFNLFLNFLLGELFQFQVYSPSCFQPLSELLIGWVVSIAGVFSKLFSTCFWTSYWASCFIPGVFFKLFSTCFWTSYWVSCLNSRCILQVVSTSFWTSYWVRCFNSRCILQVVFNLFLKFLLGELFQFQVYSPSCFQPIRSSETGWKQLGEYTWNWNNSPNKKFRKRWKTTWRIHLELKQLTQ